MSFDTSIDERLARLDTIQPALMAAAKKTRLVQPSNTEERLLLNFLADHSWSTKESNVIGEINQGVNAMLDYLRRDSVTRDLVEVLVAGFPGIIEEPSATAGFIAAAHAQPISLRGDGGTPGAQAMLFGAAACRQRAADFDQLGITLAEVPIVLLLTDGEFTDDEFFDEARSVVRELEEMRSVLFAAFYTDSADTALLKRLFNYPPVPISRLVPFFASLGKSLRTLSMKKLGHRGRDPRDIIVQGAKDVQ